MTLAFHEWRSFIVNNWLESQITKRSLIQFRRFILWGKGPLFYNKKTPPPPISFPAYGPECWTVGCSTDLDEIGVLRRILVRQHSRSDKSARTTRLSRLVCSCCCSFDGVLQQQLLLPPPLCSIALHVQLRQTTRYMVAHKCQPSPNDQARHTETTTTAH